MNRDLMLAVLAMDAYNSNGNIGTATNRNIDISPAMDMAGFSAQAYTYGGKTIISYRGTDNPFGDDTWYGWGGGVGFQTTQAALAAEFYKAVVDTASFPFSTNVAFTGHSLGGGLAGLMASLYHKEAVVFDDMAFRDAAQTTYKNATTPSLTITFPDGNDLTVSNPAFQPTLDKFYDNSTPRAINSTGVSGYQLSGQILNFQSEGQVVGGGVNWGVGSSSPGLHSISLLVLNMYADTDYNGTTAWKRISSWIGQELFAQNADTKIAYSVVDEGVRPYGDVAAHSMFGDASDIATLLTYDFSNYFFNGILDPVSHLADVAVRFAARQATNAVMASDLGNEGTGVFHKTDSGFYMSVADTIGAWGGDNVVGWEEIKTLLTQNLQAQQNALISSSAREVMDDVDYVLFFNGGSISLALENDNPMVQAGQVFSGTNNAFVFGTDEVDLIRGTQGDDFFLGGISNDVLIGGAGRDALFGGADNDILVGENGGDSLYGGDGSDLLIQGALEDRSAGSGSGGQDEVLVGGAGSDYFVLTDTDTDHVTIREGDTNDRLLLMPHLAAKTAAADGSLPLTALVGGTSETRGLYYFTYEGILISSQPATDIVTHDDGRKSKSYGYPSEDENSGISYEWFYEESLLEIYVDYQDASGDRQTLNVTIENFNEGDYGISLTTYHVGDFKAYDDNDHLTQTVEYPLAMAALERKNSELRDGVNNYTLTKDFELQQQARMSAALSASSQGTFVLDASNLVMRLDGSANDDTLNGIDLREKLFGHEGADRINAGGGNDVLYGGDGNDTLDGEAGEDLLFGGDGADRLISGEGADRLISGEGADELDGGTGVDTADYRNSATAVLVNLAAQSGFGGDAEGDMFASIENLAGSQFGDVLMGDDAVNRLQGFDGDDQLFGGGGNDRLIGGLGADVMNGGTGVDTADYSISLTGVNVHLKLNAGQVADAAGDTFIAIENLSGSDFNDTLTGDDFNNRLSGVDSNDILSGLGGIDYLVGGNGNDTMTGGAGADVFVFNLGSGDDVITDFWAGQGRTDRIQFLDGQFTHFSWVIASAVNNVAGVLISINAEDTLTLTGVQLSQLRADDFIYA